MFAGSSIKINAACPGYARWRSTCCTGESCNLEQRWDPVYQREKQGWKNEPLERSLHETPLGTVIQYGVSDLLPDFESFAESAPRTIDEEHNTRSFRAPFRQRFGLAALNKFAQHRETQTKITLESTARWSLEDGPKTPAVPPWDAVITARSSAVNKIIFYPSFGDSHAYSLPSEENQLRNKIHHWIISHVSFSRSLSSTASVR